MPQRHFTTNLRRVTAFLLGLMMTVSVTAQRPLPLPASTAHVNRMPIVTNGGFEQAGASEKDAASWTLTSTVAGSRRRCDTATKFYAHSDDCAFQLVGSPALTTQILKQAIPDSSATGDTLDLDFWVTGKSLTGTPRAKLKVKYLGGATEKLVVAIPTATYNYTQLQDAIILTGNAKKLVLKFVVNGTGKLTVDDVSMTRTLAPRAPAPVADAFVSEVGTSDSLDVTGNDDLGNPAAVVLDYGEPGVRGITPENTYELPGSNGALVTFNAAGVLSIDATAGTVASGIYQVEYQLTNSQGNASAIVTVTLGIAPTAANDAVAIMVGNSSGNLYGDNGSGLDDLGFPAAVLVSFGGGDAGGDASTYPAGTTVAFDGGLLTVNADGTFTIAGMASADATFFYRLSNLIGNSDATVSVSNAAPVNAVNDSYQLAVGGTLIVSTSDSNDLLDNDDRGLPVGVITAFTDTDGRNLIPGQTGSLGDGSLTINADGSFTVSGGSEVANFQINYTLENSVNWDTATITIFVVAP
jgi:hypothetical protein